MDPLLFSSPNVLTSWPPHASWKSSSSSQREWCRLLLCSLSFDEPHLASFLPFPLSLSVHRLHPNHSPPTSATSLVATSDITLHGWSRPSLMSTPIHIWAPHKDSPTPTYSHGGHHCSRTAVIRRQNLDRHPIVRSHWHRSSMLIPPRTSLTCGLETI